MAETAPDEVGHLCPDCGSLLDPAPGLAALIGTRVAGRPPVTTSRRHEAVVVRIEELFAHRALARERELRAGTDDGPARPSMAAQAALPVVAR